MNDDTGAHGNAGWPISACAQSWLSHWLSGGATVSCPPHNITAELNVYRPPESLTLHRAEMLHHAPTPGPLMYNEPSSWTYEPDVAVMFSNGRLPVITTTEM